MMTTDVVKQAVKQRRPAALAGGIAGVLILAGYLFYAVAMTPSKPDLRKAPPGDIIQFVANERGLEALTQVEQERFLDQWRAVLVEDEQKKAALKKALSDLGSEDRKALIEAFFKHIKRGYLADARRYKSLPADEQYAFLAEKIDEYEQRAVFMRDVASDLGPGFFGGGQDAMKQWLIEHTTEDERQLGTPYMEALAQVALQLKKQRSAAGTPGTTTTSAGSASET